MLHNLLKLIAQAVKTFLVCTEKQTLLFEQKAQKNQTFVAFFVVSSCCYS